jgi:succinyl-CoA synthetase beta subunit
MASGPKMTEFEIMMRAQQPVEAAEQRRRDAKAIVSGQKLKDDQATAKREKLQALRLAKEADDASAAAEEAIRNPPPVKAKPVRKKAVKAK